MGYGNLDECLQNSEAQIKKARKKLRKLFKVVFKAAYLADEVSIDLVVDVLQPILKIDLELLEGLNSIGEKERMCADGVKRDPKWVALDRKMFQERA